MKDNSKLTVGRARLVRLLSAAVVVGGALATVPLLTQSGFDPRSVQPSLCNPKSMKCGFVPLRAKERAAVPEDPSNLVRHRGLPSSVDLSGDMPPIGSQGRQGSCVGWATGYAMKSYHEKTERQWSYGQHVQARGGPGQHVFSPAYIYNQINNGRDSGSNPVTALRLLQRKGAATWKTMPYTDRDYRRSPPGTAHVEAKNYRIKSYAQIDHFNSSAIKSQLAAKRPVFLGIKVYANFYKLGSGVYSSGKGAFRGGHAILLVGYDDSKRDASGARGAFKIFNSWGPRWGDNGYGWISYSGMARLGLGAFAVYDLRDAKKVNPGPGPVPNPGPGPGPSKVTGSKASPPKTVSASRGTSAGAVFVSWSAVEGAVAYEVQRADAGEERYAAIGYANGTSFKDDKVQQNVSYKYRVVTFGVNGRSKPDLSPVAEGYAQRSQNARPAQVVGLQGQPDSRGRIRLSWSKVEGASRYWVQHFDERRKRWRTLGRVRGHAARHTRPARDSRNSYRVCAANSRGVRGKWSSAVTVAVAGKETPPGRVTGLTATQGYHRDRIVLAWTKVPGAKGYAIFRYNPRVRKGVYIRTPKNLAQGASFTDTSAEAKSGKSFGYFVRAVNQAGLGALSNYAKGYASAGQFRGQTLTPPKRVTGVLNSSSGTVALRWSKVKGASGYYIFAKEARSRKWAFVAGVNGKATRHTVRIRGKVGDQRFERGKLYFLVVRSKSLFGGESKNSSAVSAFINRERYLVKKRFFGNDGFEKFKGKWSTTEWDGESAPKKVTLTMQKDGNRFSGSMSVSGGRTEKFAGTFVSKSTVIESGKFRMRVVGKGVSSVEIEDKEEERRLSFSKE